MLPLFLVPNVFAFMFVRSDTFWRVLEKSVGIGKVGYSSLVMRFIIHRE